MLNVWQFVAQKHSLLSQKLTQIWILICILDIIVDWKDNEDNFLVWIDDINSAKSLHYIANILVMLRSTKNSIWKKNDQTS